MTSVHRPANGNYNGEIRKQGQTSSMMKSNMSITKTCINHILKPFRLFFFQQVNTSFHVHSYQKAKSLVDAFFMYIDAAHGQSYINNNTEYFGLYQKMFYKIHNCFLIFLQKNAQKDLLI